VRSNVETTNFHGQRVVTDAGRVTYKAGRTAETGHAEAFWAVAHALHFKPLRQRRRVVIA